MSILRRARGHETTGRRWESDGTFRARCKCGASFKHGSRFLAHDLLVWERSHARPKR